MVGGKMSDPNNNRMRAKGQVRVRSNLSTSPKAWPLVPGDTLKHYGLNDDSQLSPRQHEERMYYEPCSVCHRLYYLIQEEGCDMCQKKGKIPSTAEAEIARQTRRLMQ